mgnify:CR=1 FL=1
MSAQGSSRPTPPGTLPEGLFPILARDDDPRESSEWLEALDWVIASAGADRAAHLIERLRHHAFRRGVRHVFSATTPYVNTIPPEREPPYPGDREIERRLKSILRWAEARGVHVPAAYKGLRPLKVVRNSRSKAWWTVSEVELAFAAAAEVDAEIMAKAQGSAKRRKGEVLESPGTATLLIALGCLLGLRWEEIVMLRWQDIDLDAKDGPVAHIVPKDGWVPKDGES